MIYTLDELKQRIKPVAEKYGIRAVYLFGSYARNEATEQSDVDLMIDRSNSKIRGMFEMGGLYMDLCASIQKEVDLITLQTLEQSSTKKHSPHFVENVQAERIRLL